MLPISASKRGKLLAAGYTTLHSILRTSTTHLARGFIFKPPFFTFPFIVRVLCYKIVAFYQFTPSHYHYFKIIPKIIVFQII